MTIPAGTYTALEAKLEPAQGHDGSAAAFLAANPDFVGVSVRVTGPTTFEDTRTNFAPKSDIKMLVLDSRPPG